MKRTKIEALIYKAISSRDIALKINQTLDEQDPTEGPRFTKADGKELISWLVNMMEE